MESLRDSLTLLQYCGMWRSVNWSSNSLKSRVYWLYTICIVVIINWFILSELLWLPELKNIQDFADNCFMLMSLIAASGKAAVILIRRGEIITVLNALDRYPHTPIHIDEQNIQNKFDRRIKLLFLLYAGQFVIGAWFMTIFIYMQNLPFGVLPYKAWIPWDYSSPGMYWFLYWLQLFAVFAGAHVVSGLDTLISGFMVTICGKFDILECRLRKTIKEFGRELHQKSDNIRSEETLKIYERRIIACVKFHLAIFEMGKKINYIFTVIIFIQYFASSIIICISVFIMSQMKLFSPGFMSLFTYVWCIMLQIFMLCASGDVATVKCKSLMFEVYNTEWHMLTNRTKKYLVLMMVRTLRPIVFRSAYMVILSLESFTKLVKLSYSIYTVLQNATL